MTFAHVMHCVRIQERSFIGERKEENVLLTSVFPEHSEEINIEKTSIYRHSYQILQKNLYFPEKTHFHLNNLMNTPNSEIFGIDQKPTYLL